MDTRRFRSDSRAHRLAQARWLGWVMLMMFVLVQSAAGATGTGDRSQDFTAQSQPFLQASADFDAKTHEVTVTADPPAAAWNSTATLGRRSFVVYENNVPQAVSAVQLVHTPLSIGVLIEHGGRFHALNEAIAENASRALQDLMEALNPDDHVSLWTYGDHVEALAEPSGSATGLQRAADLSLGVAPSSESNFFDALLATLPRVQQMSGRRALIVISTGIDTFSDASYADALRAVRDFGVPVCVIDTGPMVRSSLSIESADGQPYSHLKWQQSAAQLAGLARASGCRTWEPGTSFEFPAVFDGLLPNLRLQYVIHYRTTALDLPGTREVKVAWVEGNATQRKLRNLSAQHRLFAQAHYELTPAALWASAGTLDWPFLHLSASPVQIPLRLPETSDMPSAGLLAATTTAGPGAQQP